MSKDSLGDRMKSYYEGRYKIALTRRMPVILRLDGKAFHTFTRGCEKPFDYQITSSMEQTARYLLKNIQGAKVVYTQSDEISVLITDYDTIKTDAWFDYELQKMCSISAAMASVHFTLAYAQCSGHGDTYFDTIKPAHFDCRAFNIPKEDVSNYFLWRFNDWVRNSVSMLAQAHFSHKELHKKSTADKHEMLHTKGINWNDLAERWKNGIFVFKDFEGNVCTIPLNIKEHEERERFFNRFINFEN